MGLLDSLSNFLTRREGDFVRLDSSETEFGPGPLLILYNVPAGLENDEIDDMLSDGAPQAHRKGCRIYRLTEQDHSILDMTLQESLELIMKSSSSGTASQPKTETTAGVPVLLFSGFRNDEMMSTYNIIGQEIYQELGGQWSPACAKAVPNAMGKQLRQVLEEIAGDHTSAMTEDAASSWTVVCVRY